MENNTKHNSFFYDGNGMNYDLSPNTNDEIMNMVNSVTIVYLYNGISYISYSSELTKQSLGGDIDTTQIVKILIGNRVTSIESGIFSGCTNLVGITYNGTMDEWDEVSLGTGWIEGSNIETITCIDGEVTSEQPIGGATALYLSDGSVKYFESTSITSSLLDEYGGGVTNITGITIGDDVVSITSSAFVGCNKLKTIDIPYGVTSIGSNAFYGLTNITIKLNAVYNGYSSRIFGNTTTSESTAVNQTIIFNTLTYPSGYSFSNLFTKGSSKVSFTYNVYTAINECKTQMNTLNKDQYTTVNVYDYVVVTSKITYITSNNEIITPDITKLPLIISNTYDDISGGNMLFASEIKKIGDDAFANCTTLTEITIPNTVIEIGNNAFNNVSGKIKLSALYSTLNKKLYTPVNGMVYNVEFNVNSIPSAYRISNILNVGNKNNSITINVFTDNTVVKTQAVALANSFTTVNVYHIGGSPWGDINQLYPSDNEIWYNSKNRKVESITTGAVAEGVLKDNVYEYGIGKLIFEPGILQTSGVNSSWFNLGDKLTSIMFPNGAKIYSDSINSTSRLYISLGLSAHIYQYSMDKDVLYTYYNGSLNEWDDDLIAESERTSRLKTLDIVCKDGVKKMIEQQPRQLTYYSSDECVGYKTKYGNVVGSYNSSTQLGTITFPDDTTSMDEWLTRVRPAFFNADFLTGGSIDCYTSIFIPDGVTKIEDVCGFYMKNILISIPESVNEISGRIFSPVSNSGTTQEISGISGATVTLVFHKRNGTISGLTESLPPQNEDSKIKKGNITYNILTDNQYIVQEYRKINKPDIIINLYRLNFTPW